MFWNIMITAGIWCCAFMLQEILKHLKKDKRDKS